MSKRLSGTKWRCYQILLMWTMPVLKNTQLILQTEKRSRKVFFPNSTSNRYQNLHTEPKYIVFLTKLLLLFHCCPSCKSDNPLVETRQIGSLVKVNTICGNSKCSKRENVWCSQPNMPGSKMPVGNFLRSFGILMSGGSPSRVIHLFKRIGIACISLRKYFKVQSIGHQK